MSIRIASIMILAGFINRILSLVTFLSAETRTVGSDIYLLGSSMIILITIPMLSLKFWILIAAPMSHMKTRSLFQFQYAKIDLALRVRLYLNQ